MKWSKEIPKRPGWYLRANPPCPGFQKHHLIILDVNCSYVKKGELGISWHNKLIRVSDLPSFYWLGPIRIPKTRLRS